jgi:O-antigen ligase
VFGPFLVLPALYLVHQIVTGPAHRMVATSLPLLVISLGLFLSFSRGAWGLFAACVAMLILLLLIKNRGTAFRLRIILLSLAALTLLVLAILAALQIPEVARLFETRAKLTQDYDTAQFGRFARHWLGFLLALERPLGIGPLQFGKIYGEDTHNIWLKALLDYSWIGFAAYVMLVLLTLGAGLRILFRDRPWQGIYLCAYVAFLGHVLLGAIIDTDHWRHFFMLLGIVWGGIALEARFQRRRLAAPNLPG